MTTDADGARLYRDGELVSQSLPISRSGGIDQSNVAEKLFRWVETAAIETSSWYTREKQAKARWSRRLRFVSIALAALGSIAPFASVSFDRPSYAFWGYPCLALAAGCVGIDKAFGFSSSWMRYQAAAAKVQEILVRQQMIWADLLNRPGSAEPERWCEELQVVRSFAEEISVLVATETNAWVAEFRGRAAELDASIHL